jgi:hypothetical protein
MTSFLTVFLFTVLVEVAAAACLGYRKKLEIVTVILLVCITNPLLNYIEYIDGYLKVLTINTATVLCMEAIIVVVEWLLLRFALRQDPKKLFILSVTINSCSYFGGTLFFRLLKV